MKEYIIGGNKNEVFTATVISCVMGVWIIFFTAVAVSHSSFFIVPVLFFMLPAFVFVIIYLNVYFRMSYRRKEKALKGHKGTGIVDNSYVSYKHARGLHLDIIYQTDGGEKAMLHTLLEIKYQKYFPIGKEIPLYINGEFAYFKEEEVYIDDNNVNNNRKANISFCPYCGFKLENETERCQNCNSKLQ